MRVRQSHAAHACTYVSCVYVACVCVIHIIRACWHVCRSEDAPIILEGLQGMVLRDLTKPDHLVRVQQAAINSLSVMVTGKRPAAGDLGGASACKRAKRAAPVLLGLKRVLEGSHPTLQSMKPWNAAQEAALTEMVTAINEGLYQYIQK